MAEVALVDGVETPRKGAGRAVPKWESDAKARLATAMKRFQKPLADLIGRDANEGDTRLLMTDFICDGPGYDKYSDLTTEYQVKGEFTDYGVRIDKQLVAFVEVKRITTKLDAKHLRQVEMYAVNEGVEWMILTNGKNWKVYHLSPGMPAQIDVALDIDLNADDASGFFYLTRESLKRRQIDELWRAARATSPKSMAQVLLSEPVIAAVQRELKRQASHAVSPDEIAELLRAGRRAECFEK
jgi:hypothetical protein